MRLICSRCIIVNGIGVAKEIGVFMMGFPRKVEMHSGGNQFRQIEACGADRG